MVLNACKHNGVMALFILLCCFLGSFLFSPVVYAADPIPAQCVKISCQCQQLSRPAWQESCTNHQQSIYDRCVAGSGSLVDYCRWQGAYAFPVALAGRGQTAEPVNSVEASLESAKTVDSQLWSLNQDLVSARQFFTVKKFGAQATALKKLDAHLLALASKAVALAVFYQQQGEDQLEAQQKVVAGMQSLFDQLQQSYQLWGDDADLAASKYFKRILRYQGNLNEHQGLWFERRGLLRQASMHWQQAGDFSKRLQVLAVNNKSKQKFVDYYRNQAASRWSRSADLAQRSGQIDDVDGLAEKADKLWSSAK